MLDMLADPRSREVLRSLVPVNVLQPKKCLPHSYVVPKRSGTYSGASEIM